MNQKGRAAGRLADVIRVAQLARRTGVLKVERGEGAALEEGTIIFFDGKVIDAHAGNKHGAVAFQWLSSHWENCRFSFDSSQTAGALLPGNAGAQSVSPSQAARIPYRTQNADQSIYRLDHLSLSRAHRHLLLLIDGKRTLPELVQLLGRGPEEVERLLADLEQAGFIAR